VLDVFSIIDAEHDENEARKDFTTEERVAIARAIEAEIGERRGRPGADREIPQHLADLRPGQETRDYAAKKAGFGNRETYRQATAVVEHGAPNVATAGTSRMARRGAR
jgi:hypothetical protein